MTDKPKSYTMLKTVPGSRDGIQVESFAKGKTYDDLPEDLVEQFFHQGAIEEAEGNASANANQTEVPETTTTQDGESGVKLSTQRIEELVSVARDKFGLDVNSLMSEQHIRQLIEEARGKKDEPATDKEVEASAPEDKGEGNPAEERETKVTGPEETKPAKVSETKTTTKRKH